MTYNDSGDALLRIATLLQVLRDDCEDAGRKRHVEKAMGLSAILLNLLEVLLELLEGLVLVILTRNIGAELGELLELILSLFGGSLHVRLDSAQVLLAVHLSTGISDDVNIFRQELIPVLERGQY